MTFIYFILILSIVVFVHELGHLLVAKMFHVYCHEFALGFGPVLFSFQGKETKYSLRLIPFGGFVSMAGESKPTEEAVEIEFKRTIKGISPLKRIFVMLAGILMNLVLAMAIFISIFMITKVEVLPPPAIIGQVQVGSPAEQAGILVNDEIISVLYPDGTMIKPKTFYDLLEFQPTDTTFKVSYEIKRGTINLTFKITPIYDTESGRYLIGISALPATIKELSFTQRITTGIQETFTMIKMVAMALLNLLRGIGLNQLSGPLGIMQTTGEVMGQARSLQETILMFLSLTGSISINVALFNLLPVPAFDGGRVILTLAEIIKGGPLDPKWEERLIVGSFFLLLLLFIFITYQDVLKIFFGG